MNSLKTRPQTRSPEYHWWIENERERMTRSQRWRVRPNIFSIAVVALAAVAIWAIVTM